MAGSVGGMRANRLGRANRVGERRDRLAQLPLQRLPALAYLRRHLRWIAQPPQHRMMLGMRANLHPAARHQRARLWPAQRPRRRLRRVYRGSGRLQPALGVGQQRLTRGDRGRGA